MSFLTYMRARTALVCFLTLLTKQSYLKIVLISTSVFPLICVFFKCEFSNIFLKNSIYFTLKKLVINICEMIILTHKKKSDFYLKYWRRYSTLKILHFKGMDNLMIMLIPLFPNSALAHHLIHKAIIGPIGHHATMYVKVYIN